MPRPPNVSRTFRVSKCTVVLMDILTNETTEQEIVLPKLYTNTTGILKYAKRELETDNLRVVYVKDVIVNRMRYTMTEKKFIENADTAQEI